MALENPAGAAPEKNEQPLAPGLYLVATPIGNLQDITLRALRVLRLADRIACEDTRQSAKLLAHFGIGTPAISLHEHNEQARTADDLLPLLVAGGRVAVISDAGTPGISDPGMLLVRAAVAAGVPVFPVPGANAGVAALVASGLATDRFTFHGFLPEKSGPRRTALERLATLAPDAGTQIFYEAPHRILDTLSDVDAVFGARARVVLARELTKVHEEFIRGTAAGVREALGSRERVRGEMVLLLEIAAASPGEAPGRSLRARVLELQRTETLSEKDALKRAAREWGLGKSEAYRELQRERAAAPARKACGDGRPGHPAPDPAPGLAPGPAPGLAPDPDGREARAGLKRESEREAVPAPPWKPAGRERL